MSFPHGENSRVHAPSACIFRASRFHFPWVPPAANQAEHLRKQSAWIYTLQNGDPFSFIISSWQPSTVSGLKQILKKKKKTRQSNGNEYNYKVKCTFWNNQLISFIPDFIGINIIKQAIRPNWLPQGQSAWLCCTSFLKKWWNMACAKENFILRDYQGIVI